MEHYIVSARKYRPTTFETVVGQKALTTTLKNAIATGKLAHAYLFCGPRGVGKTTCARIFAKTINCLSPLPGGEACGHCESCVAFDEQRSYNIHELDAASNNSVEDIRSLIEQVHVPPQVGRYKVFIIDEVHMLSSAAFNAFLKTLEEPPAHAIFILATTEKHKILPTILSRCQVYDFNRMEVADIVNHLATVATREGVRYEEAALHVIAQKADGGMRDALSIFDQVVSFTGGDITYAKTIENLNVLDYEYYFRITGRLLAGDVGECLLLFNEILSKGFEGSHFIGGLASHFRNLLVSRDASTLSLLEVADSVRDRYREQAAHCTPKLLYRALKLCNDCDLNYRASRNKRLLVELTLIELAQLSSGDEPPSGPAPTERPKAAGQAASPASASSVGTQKTSSPTTSAALSEPRPAYGSPASQSPAPDAVARTDQRPAASFPASQSSVSNGTAGNSVREALKRSASGRATSTVAHLSTVSVRGRMTKAEDTDAPAVPQQDEPDWGNEPFDEQALSYHWRTFAASLPQEQAATAARMKNMKLRMLSGSDFEVVVENQQVKHYLDPLVPDIERALRKGLKNSHVHMHLRVAEAGEQSRPYTKREQYQQMLERSAGLRLLNEEFGLKLS